MKAISCHFSAAGQAVKLPDWECAELKVVFHYAWPKKKNAISVQRLSFYFILFFLNNQHKCWLVWATPSTCLLHFFCLKKKNQSRKRHSDEQLCTCDKWVVSDGQQWVHWKLITVAEPARSKLVRRNAQADFSVFLWFFAALEIAPSEVRQVPVGPSHPSC